MFVHSGLIKYWILSLSRSLDHIRNDSETLISPTSLALFLGFGWLLRAGPRLRGLSVIGLHSVDGLTARGESFGFFFCFCSHKVTEEC